VLTTAVIQLVVIILFSTTPNSMADERTVSVVTSINTPHANNQLVATIADQVQIKQWYVYDEEMHKKQQENRPTPRFHTLKQYRTVDYVTDRVFPSNNAMVNPLELPVDPNDSDIEVGLQEADDMSGDLSTLSLSDSPAINVHTAFAEILAEVNPDSPLVASILDDHAPKDTATVSILPKAAPKLSNVSLVSKDDVYPELS
jgi:hypothetical protein